ncbi:LETM1 domain-containing protein 1-like [Artemia franciscana]|uniref:LETM1 domain-containing protein 1-like n=1 Tax=Artemia franciscana TaxID=6661 RepID=UPI0032DB76F0
MPGFNMSQIRRFLRSTKIQIKDTAKRKVFKRYLDFIGKYEEILQKKFPKAMKVYRVFSVGFKDFYGDVKEFARVARLARLSENGSLQHLTRKEIEIYDKIPRDILKVSPVLLLTPLPFTNYLVFPLAYMFPRQLLCSHFWSLQQRIDFAVQLQRKRLLHYKPLFRCLQARVDSISDKDLRSNFQNILYKLGSGMHPTTNEIISVKPLFSDRPFHLNLLWPSHKNNLLRVHGLSPMFGFRRRARLTDKAYYIREMDLAYLKEGVNSMTLDELRNACFMRGLNPVNMRTEDMVEWLAQWSHVASNVDESSYSLLLHCPVLLGYNQPTNWVLIH